MRILAVDDDPIAQAILKNGLDLSGFKNITLAGSAPEALKLIDEAVDPFECILLDVQMPDFDGIELCSRVRNISTYSETPIIMVTAMENKSFIKASFLAGATDYVTKPFDIFELVARVGVAQKLSNQLQKLAQNAEDISELKKQVENLNPNVAAVAFNISADSFVHFQRFENLIQQLKPTDLLKTQIDVFCISRFKDIAAGLNETDLVMFLTDVAIAISDVLTGDDRIFSYCGNGQIINLSSNLPDTNVLNSETKRDIQERVRKISGDYPIEKELLVKLHFGQPTSFNKNTAANPMNSVRDMLRAAKTWKIIIRGPNNELKANGNTQAQNELEKRVRGMVPKYLSVLNEFLVRLDIIYESMLEKGSSKAEITEISRISHRISGVAPTLGFVNLGSIAAKVEKLADASLTSDSENISGDSVGPAVLSLLDEIEDLIVNNLGDSQLSPAVTLQKEIR